MGAGSRRARWVRFRRRIATGSDTNGTALALTLGAVVAVPLHPWWQVAVRAAVVYVGTRVVISLVRGWVRSRRPVAPPLDESYAPGSYSVQLDDGGKTKIAVIKEVRSVTSLPLKEAKLLVDSAPSRIREGIAEDAAQSIKAQLERTGASASVVPAALSGAEPSGDRAFSARLDGSDLR